ncbi:hypothetical protein [Huintestinicola sp.]
MNDQKFLLNGKTVAFAYIITEPEPFYCFGNVTKDGVFESETLKKKGIDVSSAKIEIIFNEMSKEEFCHIGDLKMALDSVNETLCKVLHTKRLLEGSLYALLMKGEKGE